MMTARFGLGSERGGVATVIQIFGTKQPGQLVGFIEKNGRQITFATHLIEDSKEKTIASFDARNEALDKLWHIINELEK